MLESEDRNGNIVRVGSRVRFVEEGNKPFNFPYGMEGVVDESYGDAVRVRTTAGHYRAEPDDIDSMD